MTDKLDIIQIINALKSQNTNLSYEDKLACLKNYGYTSDIKWCKYNNIFFFINKDIKKLIIYFDGIDQETENDILTFNFNKLLDYSTIYISDTVEITKIINEEYSDYKKLYLGFSFGGYIINNYITSDNNGFAYTFNSFGFKYTNSEIATVNYCDLLDLIPTFWKFFENNKIKHKILNFDLIRLLNLILKYNFTLQDILVYPHTSSYKDPIFIDF